MASEEWAILNNPNALIEPGHNLLFGCWIACVLVAAIAVRLLDSVLKASLRARWPQEHFMAEPLQLSFPFFSRLEQPWYGFPLQVAVSWQSKERGTHVLP
jgi:hypothetical protein